MNCTRKLETSSRLQNWVIVKRFTNNIHYTSFIICMSYGYWKDILHYTQKHLGQRYKLQFSLKYWFHCKNNNFLEPKSFSPILVQSLSLI